mgnify:FL=1
MPPRDLQETRASARLPHLDIDIVHRRAREGDAEQILISLQATPSFQAFGQVLEAANPFEFWARLAETAWAPWLQAMQAWSSLPGLTRQLATAPDTPPAEPPAIDAKRAEEN